MPEIDATARTLYSYCQAVPKLFHHPEATDFRSWEQAEVKDDLAE